MAWRCNSRIRVGGGEIVSDVLMLMVLILCTIGFTLTSISRFKEKREGRA